MQGLLIMLLYYTFYLSL